ncbi:MAG: T9SS type A sorting domain-containing protein, partial [Candidatus Kapaibacteriota bacterium]
IYKDLTIYIWTNNSEVLVNDKNFLAYKIEMKDSAGSKFLDEEPPQDSENEYYVNLRDGCYDLNLISYLQCGLGFWYYRQLFGLRDGLFQVRSDNLILFQPNVDFGSSIYYSFIAEDQPTVAVIPDTIDFGDVSMDSEYFANVLVKPANEKPISIWDFKVVLGEIKGVSIQSIEPVPGQDQKITLGKGDSAKILLKLSPKKYGKVSTSLTFSSNDKKNPLVSIPIRANVVGGSGVEIINCGFDIHLVKKEKNTFEFVVDSDLVDPISCEVYNIIGNKLLNISEWNNTTSKITINLNSFANGLYFAKFSQGGFTKVIPILLINE